MQTTCTEVTSLRFIKYCERVVGEAHWRRLSMLAVFRPQTSVGKAKQCSDEFDFDRRAIQPFMDPLLLVSFLGEVGVPDKMMLSDAICFPL